MYRSILFTTVWTLLLATLRGAENPREQVTRIVSQIQRADYEGDRKMLQKCYEELTPSLDNKELASRIRYWRGFALWRRAINGFNDSVDPKELEQDIQKAIEELKIALQQDQAFVDAKIGIINCLGLILSMHVKDDPARAKELAPQILALVEEAKKAAPDNPRLRWVLSPILWHQARAAGIGNEKVMQNLREGLDHCPVTVPNKDSLQPSWGKPELLVSLAYIYFNGSPQNLEAAESNARGALDIVPYWHYTRDILLPQILAAKEKAAGK